MSDEMGPADGLSHPMYQHLVKTLGEPYAPRLVSAERVVSEFRSRRVASEIVAFGEAAGNAIQLAERALSNEVITTGRTTLEDVAWWLQDRLLERGLGSEFDMPSIYVTGPDGIAANSSLTWRPRLSVPTKIGSASPSSSSTWTISRRSTTASVIRSVMPCCKPSVSGCARMRPRRMRSAHDSAVMNSP